MVWEAVRFLFFSNIEAFAVFTIMLSIFRLKSWHYFWPAMFVFLAMNLQSYFLREALNLSFLVPAITIIVYILLIATIVRVPILWAGIISVTGMFLYTLLQLIVIMALFGDLNEDMQFSIKGTVVQIVTSLWTLFISWLLNKFKIGFDAEFERFRLKWEHIIVIVFILVALTASAVVMFVNNMLYIMLFLIIVSAMFLYYALRKERENLQEDEED